MRYLIIINHSYNTTMPLKDTRTSVLQDMSDFLDSHSFQKQIYLHKICWDKFLIKNVAKQDIPEKVDYMDIIGFMLP